ncbi:MAG: hypothetical protein JNM98_19420 [Rhodocyclaceae bacterium]|nr:hypothetical protein [Rhodocyclaceae bacterium]
MTIALAFIFGIILGAGNWAIVPLVSDRIEPFDSEPAFYIGQCVLCLSALALAWRSGFLSCLTLLFGAWAGLNLYPLLLGTPEHRAWFLLGMFTSVLLLIYPLVCGIMGWLVRRLLTRYKLHNPQTRAAGVQSTKAPGERQTHRLG